MWEVKKLGELAVIGRGSSPRPIIDQIYFHGGKIPWIKIADATSSSKYINKTKEHVNEYGASFSRKLNAGSLILSSSGVSLGIPTFLGVEGCIDDGWLYFYNYNGIDPEYLYYQLIALRAFFNALSYGAAIPNINTGIVKNTKIKLPPILMQQKIANILSTYDFLIENNNRRIELLEQASQQIYKEWFIRFRFPGHETTKFIKAIPEGWEIKRLKEFGHIETGKTPPTVDTENYGGEIMFIKTPDMHGKVVVVNTEDKLTQKGYKTQPKKLLPANSICVSCIGTGGVVAINSEQAHTNQQINSIIPLNSSYVEWLYFTCKELKPTIEMFGATGATMTNLSKGKFEKLKVICPPKSLVTSFHKITNSMINEIKVLQLKNQYIIKQRDLLLPRFMSGKI